MKSFYIISYLDFSLEEVTVSRCFLLVQEGKRKQKVNFPDTTPISKDVSDGDQKLKSNESSSSGAPSCTENFMTACENVKTLYEQQDYPTEKDYTESSYDREICEAPFEKIIQRMTQMMIVRSQFSLVTCIWKLLLNLTNQKLKNIFGVSNTVKEVKVSVTKELFFEKSMKVWNKQLHKKGIAPIIIWDFGGQDVFYSTHQTFLTHRAIYIIVLDGSRRLDDPCPYEQYLPGKSGHKTAREISRMFQQTPIMPHLVIDDKIFVNTKDTNDPEMAIIKGVIIRESEKQPAWGEYLPKCFIPLELEFASLIRRNIPLITLEHLTKINSLQSVRQLSETELKVFLKFQHSIGKLLYFDKPKLDDRIILSPTLLIDAFKSIVTDRMFCQGDKEGEELWDVKINKGVVSKYAIQQIWKKKKYPKFYKDKDYLLDVMTHLDILVEPKRYDSDHNRIPADFYYVASMVRAKDDSGYLQSAGFTNRSIAIAFQSSSLMIPPALSFRFISYCLYVWAVKTNGETNMDMLFHRSGVFTIDPSLDMYIACEDERIVVRLVHATSNTLIMRDVASSIYECLTSALEKISQLYIRTSSDQSQTSDASFITRICCNSPDNPCFLPVNDLANTDPIWICPAHDIEHIIHTIASWIAAEKHVKFEDTRVPLTSKLLVNKEKFLKATPSDLHLHRLSLLYSPFEAKELGIHLGLSYMEVENVLQTEDPSISIFEILRQCRDRKVVTFKEIKEALETIGKQSIHILCKTWNLKSGIWNLQKNTLKDWLHWISKPLIHFTINLENKKIEGSQSAILVKRVNINDVSVIDVEGTTEPYLDLDMPTVTYA
ncbi:LRRK2 [Mytilus edulis]|uniref:LRRK2 n=1 Tax=Mytilus edulis TaxID=6550 RepID=A0A8S3QT50_MYTED|nr:LRRK2 [Mytilus edulis]